MFHLVSFWWITRTNYIPELGVDYKEVRILIEGCLTGKNEWELLTGDDGGRFCGIS
jgi:hypothetical protein